MAADGGAGTRVGKGQRKVHDMRLRKNNYCARFPPFLCLVNK